MKPVQKILTTVLWIVFVLAMVSVIGAGMWGRARRGGSTGGAAAFEIARAGDEEADSLAPKADVPAFALVDQDGQPVTDESLRGKVWIASFVFTHCAGPCPVMTEKMSVLEKTLTDPRVQFVSVSVDPERDTPTVLKAYAKEHHANESRWRFLTGGGKDATVELSRGMLLAALPAQGNDPIIHSTKFVLVDARGKIRSYY